MSNLITYQEREEDDEHGTLGRPFRIKARLYNNRLVQARLEAGFKTQMDAVKGLGISQHMINGYEALRIAPWNDQTSTWKSSAQALADALGYSPEELWPECVLEVKQRYMELEMSARSIALSKLAEAPDTDRQELSEQVRKALKGLSPREEKVIRRRFGIDCEEETLDQIAANLERRDRSNTQGVTKEVVRQVERKALRKLARPGPMSTMLKLFIDPQANEQMEREVRWRNAWATLWGQIGRELAMNRSQEQHAQRVKTERRARTERERLLIEAARAEEVSRKRNVKVGEVLAWCGHLERAESITAHQTALPSTAYFIRDGKQIHVHWYAECEGCWKMRILTGLSIGSEKIYGGEKVKKSDLPKR